MTGIKTEESEVGFTRAAGKNRRQRLFHGHLNNENPVMRRSEDRPFRESSEGRSDMLGRMKTQVTNESGEITIVVPIAVLDKVASEIKALLEKMEDEGINGHAASPAKNVTGSTTPGRLLRGLRYKENLTQVEFGRKLGVKQHHISEMERNIRPISKAMAHKVEETFGISYKVFL